MLVGVKESVTSVVRVRDNTKGPQPRGKQSQRYHDWGCFYTRTTGIWQTVWMEPIQRIALRRPHITPDVPNSLLRLEQPVTNNAPGLRLRAIPSDAHCLITTAQIT